MANSAPHLEGLNVLSWLNGQIHLTPHDKDRVNASTAAIKSVQIVFVTLQNKNKKNCRSNDAAPWRPRNVS